MAFDKNITAIGIIHKAIDLAANRLTALHASRLHCAKGCCDCCCDDLSVFEVEALNIRHFNEDLLKTAKPHEKGACAFLDNKGACRIYEQRPYVCRTQGLPLHWIDDLEDGTTVAMRDICPLNDPGEPIEELPQDACWEIGPFEEELSRLQREIDNGEMRRVKLRDLFATEKQPL